VALCLGVGLHQFPPQFAAMSGAGSVLSSSSAGAAAAASTAAAAGAAAGAAGAAGSGDWLSGVRGLLSRLLELYLKRGWRFRWLTQGLLAVGALFLAARALHRRYLAKYRTDLRATLFAPEVSRAGLFFEIKESQHTPTQLVSERMRRQAFT
jgi:hypothetical protein